MIAIIQEISVLYHIYEVQKKYLLSSIICLPLPHQKERRKWRRSATHKLRQISWNALWERKTQDGGQNWIAEEKSSRLAKRERAWGSKKGWYSPSIDWWRRKVSYWLRCFWWFYTRLHVARCLWKTGRLNRSGCLVRWDLRRYSYVLRLLNVLLVWKPTLIIFVGSFFQGY